MRLRPTLQSYVAADAFLLKLNAQHLQDVHAPDRIILAEEYRHDEQYWAFFDSLSWPVLLTHYDAVGQIGKHLVLHRTSQPRPHDFGPIERRTFTLGEWTQVPPVPPGANGLWARIDLHPTWTGKAVGLFYKRPIMLMEIQYDNARTSQFRFMPGVARAGFLLAPTIEFDRSWPLFAMNNPVQPHIAWDRVERLRIMPMTPGNNWPSYSEQVTAEYQGFYFKPQPRPRKPGPTSAQ